MQPLPLESIRQAVSSGEFGRAQLLWRECSAALAEELTNDHLTKARLAEVREMLAEARELMEWSRLVVLCARAHLQDRLNTLHVAREYEIPALARTHRIVEASF
jgi:hypothetical protein